MNSLSPKLFIWRLIQLFFLSAGILCYEIVLTRLFSVTQFYHFAFMVVSIALMGFGASGTVLALLPTNKEDLLSNYSDLLLHIAAASILLAHIVTNKIPFDSYQIAWNPKQWAIMVLHYILLVIPFFIAGFYTSLCLSVSPQLSGRIYAINLVGSGVGCLVAIGFPLVGGGEGTVLLAASLIAFPMLRYISQKGTIKIYAGISFLITILFAIDTIFFTHHNIHLDFFQLNISPYKSLSYALQYPNAVLKSQKWNSISRVDVVESSGIRSLPGMSYRYTQSIPQQIGVFIDADNLRPVLMPEYQEEVFAFLPSSVVYALLNQPNVLILEAGGGLDILAAKVAHANKITAAEINPLVIQAASWVYEQPNVLIFQGLSRSILSNSDEKYDLIVFSLAESFHAVRSGAYSLNENYNHTIEAYADAFGKVNAYGYVFITRWLQNPPTESLRTFSNLIQALRKYRITPEQRIFVFRGYNTISFIVSKHALTSQEIAVLRGECEKLAYDVVYFPGILASDANKFNVLPEPAYYSAFQEILDERTREVFYASYPFDVKAISDDNPFFDHYFKWSQVSDILQGFGKSWQPFGGAGFLIIFIILFLVLIAAGLFIWMPLFLLSSQKYSKERLQQHPDSFDRKSLLPAILLFITIGLGFLFIEIPLIQKYILYLGHPTIAFCVVLFSLLTASAAGSIFSHKIQLSATLLILSLFLLLFPFEIQYVFEKTLDFNLAARIFIAGFLLFPPGFLMGMPFPSGLTMATQLPFGSKIVPILWAVNGTFSVVASITATLLAMSIGFNWVLRIGAVFYFIASLAAMGMAFYARPRSLHQ